VTLQSKWQVLTAARLPSAAATWSAVLLSKLPALTAMPALMKRRSSGTLQSKTHVHTWAAASVDGRSSLSAQGKQVSKHIALPCSERPSILGESPRTGMCPCFATKQLCYRWSSIDPVTSWLSSTEPQCFGPTPPSSMYTTPFQVTSSPSGTFQRRKNADMKTQRALFISAY
jgi:hypothetical protein